MKKINNSKEKWRFNNPDYNHQYYLKNKEHLIKKAAKWASDNPEKVREYKKKSASAHPEWVKIKNDRRRSSSRGKLRDRMSYAIWLSLHGAKSGRSWEKLAGYTADKLKKHLEQQFTKEMTWENYGEFWEIDHIIPISAFNFQTPDDIDFKRCWALKNLQPLEKSINRSKGAKLKKHFQPSLLLGVI